MDQTVYAIVRQRVRSAAGLMSRKSGNLLKISGAFLLQKPDAP